VGGVELNQIKEGVKLSVNTGRFPSRLREVNHEPMFNGSGVRQPTNGSQRILTVSKIRTKTTFKKLIVKEESSQVIVCEVPGDPVISMSLSCKSTDSPSVVSKSSYILLSYTSSHGVLPEVLECFQEN
jgi:hypothetical protein